MNKGYIIIHKSPLKDDMEKMKSRDPDLYKMMADTFKWNCNSYPQSYDILVRRFSRKLQKELESMLYQVDCPVVPRYLRRHPFYKYVGSEDTGHVDFINESVGRLIGKLEKNGFKTIVVEDDLFDKIQARIKKHRKEDVQRRNINNTPTQ